MISGYHYISNIADKPFIRDVEYPPNVYNQVLYSIYKSTSNIQQLT